MTRPPDDHDEDTENAEVIDHEQTWDEPESSGVTDPQSSWPLAPAAPVVTDDGVYGTLPDPHWAEREYAHQDRPWRDTLVRLFGMLLAISTAISLLLYSTHQATGWVVAEPALGSIVETMTGLPGLLVIHEEVIRTTGDIPGYPLNVTVPAEDRDAGTARWREVILSQSSALLYESGADAFAPEEGATTEGTFSTSGGTQLLINNLSASRNERAGMFLWPAGIVALVLALSVLAVGSRFGRFQALGIALAAAAVLPIAAGGLAYALVMFAGSDGSALAEANHEIAWSIAGIPFRNGVTMLAVGLAVGAAGRIAAAIFDRDQRTDLREELEYE